MLGHLSHHYLLLNALRGPLPIIPVAGIGQEVRPVPPTYARLHATYTPTYIPTYIPPIHYLCTTYAPTYAPAYSSSYDTLNPHGNRHLRLKWYPPIRLTATGQLQCPARTMKSLERVSSRI
jgi:hypothetical protein